MSIDTVKNVFAEDIEQDDELDFAEDEYGYNDKAEQSFAVVNSRSEWWDGTTGEPWITLVTNQGTFDMPSSHLVKKKVVD